MGRRNKSKYLKNGDKRRMTALLVYGGFILFVAVIVILAILTTKYSQKHNPEFWWS